MMKHFFTKMRHWLAARHVPIILACVAMALTLPAVGTGWQFDDYIHRAILSGEWQWPVEDISLFGTFSFANGNPERNMAMVEAGIWPWWMFEELRAAFWRPLTEITHWVDYQLWPDSPSLMHLHSLLWFGAVVWVIAKLYRKIRGVVWAAGLAGVLFAIDNAHGLPAAWIAHRNTLVVAFFGGLALLAHVRWRQDGWQHGAFWGPVCFIFAFLSGEAALAIGAYLFAYTLFLERGSLRRKVLVFLPYAFISTVWGLTYSRLGFGTLGTGAYIDPNRETSLFFNALLERFPILLLGQFAEPPADLYGFDFYRVLWPHGNEIVWSIAVAVLVLIGIIIYPLFRRDMVTRFWTVGMLLALVPVCATFPHNRLLFFPSIGAMGVIARFLESRVDQAEWLPKLRLWKWGARVLGILFIIVHLVIAPLTLPLQTLSFAFIQKVTINDAAFAMPYDDDITEKTVVLVNPPVAFWGLLYSMVRGAHGYPVPARTRTLASGGLPLTITRIDKRTIDIECRWGLLQLTMDQILRGSSAPMHVGDRIELSDMSVEVLEIADMWQPSRARFRFSVPLENRSILLFRWEKGRFVPYTPPAIDESEILAPIQLF